MKNNNIEIFSLNIVDTQLFHVCINGISYLSFCLFIFLFFSLAHIATPRPVGPAKTTLKNFSMQSYGLSTFT